MHDVTVNYYKVLGLIKNCLESKYRNCKGVAEKKFSENKFIESLQHYHFQS